jgi:hypothetical protein
MARQEKSRIKFDISVTGVDDARELSQLMPKLIKQFAELEKRMESYEQTKAKASGGSSGSRGRSGSGRQDISERITGMELDVIQGNIDSVQQLNAAYGSLTNQMNAYERAGNATNSLRVRAVKQYEKLRQVIEDRVKANEEENQSIVSLVEARQDHSNVMRSEVSGLEDSAEGFRRSSHEIATTADTYKNSSYVFLNAGYLIQDSPYGIRGMANNVSQLVQAWHLMDNKIHELNNTHETQLTMWGELRKALTGRVGLILIIGSVLPTALVLLERHWGRLLGSNAAANEEMERTLQILNRLVEASRGIRGLTGEDPLGFESMRSEVILFGNALSELEQLSNLQTQLSRINNATAGAHQELDEWGKVIGYTDPELQKLYERIEEIRESLEDQGWDLSLTQTREHVEELMEQFDRARRVLSSDDLVRELHDLSIEVEGLVRSFDLTADELIPDEAHDEVIRDMESALSRLSALALEAWEERSLESMARLENVLLPMINQLRDKLDDGVSDEEWFEDQYEFRKQMMEDLISLRIFTAEHELDTARNTNQMLLAADKLYHHELEQLRMQEFHNEHERRLAYERLELDHAQLIKDIKRDQVLFELEMENLLLEEGIDSTNSFDEKISLVEEYYARREQIIRESIENENELQRALYENERNLNDEKFQLEREYHDAKMNLVQGSSQFAIMSAQAVANFTTKNNEAQFRINQVASASMAIINAHLAYTKTIADGGFLSVPLAKIVLASGYAQAAMIMSQNFRGRKGGRSGGGGFSALTSYRGFEFNEDSVGFFESGGQPFRGSSSVGTTEPAQSPSFPRVVTAKFTDGFGKIVSQGTLDLQSQNKHNLGYWSE